MYEESRDREEREYLKAYLVDYFANIEDLADWVVEVMSEEEVAAHLDGFLSIEEEIGPGSYK
jgi:hypothetical protein